ncbi:hypothetical protein DDB_G0280095 [Dictyostelium discoideum AX4]|uniref:Uncharacterized protein n=1 Tax=Dictyostelium discoideum TaxID=44689 RepID=Q54VW6_DICDI|nr:hypothetical protein DDB_G0280095 [Dictyostelium discoideum AX4]EAL67274.1 hypothetical protein DDB_G0280095 [Dictyostelium discoideum AX4]|eukprot:XP_641239.1 hypothetical protein DDB_G0280095 [Dictyostelium discoideum AX4]
MIYINCFINLIFKMNEESNYGYRINDDNIKNLNQCIGDITCDYNNLCTIDKCGKEIGCTNIPLKCLPKITIGILGFGLLCQLEKC